MSLAFIGSSSYGFSSQTCGVLDKEKIYVPSSAIFIDQDRLFINFDDQFVEFNSISRDHLGLFVQKSDINERERTWICKNGHLITDGSQVCPACGDVRK